MIHQPHTTVAILLAALLTFALTDSTRAAQVYQENFTISGTLDDNFSTVGWFGLLTQNGEITNFTHTGVSPDRSAGVHATSDYAYFSPRNRTDVANAPALVYTDEAPLGEINTLTSVVFDVIGDNTDVEYRVAVQVAGSWYASSQVFQDTRSNPGPPHSTGTYVARQFMPAAFETAANWLALNNTTLGATSDIALGSAPGSDLTGIVTGIGLYLDAGSTPDADGDTVRFDAFTVNAVPTPAALPAGLAMMGLLMMRRRR